MKFTLDTAQGILIHSSQPGELILKIPADEPGKPHIKQSFSSSLILGDTNQPEIWAITDVVQLTEKHFEKAWQNQPDIVLLGTGQRLQFPEMEIRQQFGLKGIGLEVMDTAAASRTYNVLVAEDRSVMAFLIVN
ncbi:MAG: MTH938/NDUFAF3 family protein [Gammaproteobacteria bacterium]|nr:MTH938/NDUFAF3 family protein [Gammaproteobacteria bacterium]